MEILHTAESMDLDVAGDFIAMAAQLVYIKSKMLLPKAEEDEAEDPRAGLVEQLLEYQRMKEMTPCFRDRLEAGRDIIAKPTRTQRRARPGRVPSVSGRPRARGPCALGALAAGVCRPPATAFRGIVGREAVPVGVKIAAILRQFAGRARLRFASLFAGAKSRSEVVATFLAVLELSKERRIRIDGAGEDPELTLMEDDTA